MANQASFQTKTKFTIQSKNYYVDFELYYTKGSPGFSDRNIIRLQAIETSLDIKELDHVIEIFQEAKRRAEKLIEQMPELSVS